MSYEIRKGANAIKGVPHDVRGSELEIGQQAPDFELVANDFSVKTLADYAGKVKLISVVPSLATGICDAQTRRFNEEASNLGDEVVILTVSADLPQFQKQWCGNAGVDRVETLSTHKDMKFSDDYGVHDLDWRENQRSIFVLDADNVVRYTEYVPEIASFVDYDAALEAVKKVLD
jgi:thiol peroxidase